uniref:Uncharacterized protein n=1 Tax=Klebsiella pneumoniae TaxID=573 RepID=A0A411KVP1_KLEPN|nr:hypothetical protein pKPB11_024 [Klebsiella pneumoniae]
MNHVWVKAVKTPVRASDCVLGMDRKRIASGSFLRDHTARRSRTTGRSPRVSEEAEFPRSFNRALTH